MSNFWPLDESRLCIPVLTAIFQCEEVLLFIGHPLAVMGVCVTERASLCVQVKDGTGERRNSCLCLRLVSFLKVNSEFSSKLST